MKSVALLRPNEPCEDEKMEPRQMDQVGAKAIQSEGSLWAVHDVLKAAHFAVLLLIKRRKLFQSWPRHPGRHAPRPTD
jgi:hypothetical protein